MTECKQDVQQLNVLAGIFRTARGSSYVEIFPNCSRGIYLMIFSSNYNNTTHGRNMHTWLAYCAWSIYVLVTLHVLNLNRWLHVLRLPCVWTIVKICEQEQSYTAIYARGHKSEWGAKPIFELIRNIVLINM